MLEGDGDCMRITKPFFILFLCLFSIISYYLVGEDASTIWRSFISPPMIVKEQPALKIFPLNESVKFSLAKSRLNVEDQNRENYKLQLQTISETTAPAYLRQDISLIYSNGFLVGKLYGGKVNTAYLEQNFTIKGKGSTRYNVITFHHAEIHQEDKITSQQTMSHDRIYILSSAFTSSSMFRKPQTNTQKQWKRILDFAIKEQWEYQWNYLIKFYNIDSSEYELIPFIQLVDYMEKPLPNLSMEQSQKVIGGIWEGIYRYYVLGLNDHKQQEIETKGSTVPILLLAKDGTHLKILFRTAEGQEIQLIQNIKSP